MECYNLSKHLPDTEKFGMITQIRRAALSVHLNIAEGASRKSEIERKRFYEISRSSIVEIDAALDIAKALTAKGITNAKKVSTNLKLTMVM